MLELRNISRIYKQKKGPQVNALDDVSLTFNDKGMIFILGKSGSGKSTLLNVIGGLDKYTSGDLIIKGKSTSSFSQNEFDSYRNTMIGFIFQEYNILDEFTVGQNIGIALELQGKKADSEEINKYLNLLDMQGYANRKPNTLSGGQKQRVAIARALVKNPDIIMADEPTGALDSTTGKQLLEALQKLSETKLVIVVTHDHEFAETYGDRIIQFSDGKVIRDVTKEKTSIEHKTIFNDNNITITAGYQLTENDVMVINDYLQKKASNVEITIQNSTHSFIDSVQPTLNYQPESLTLIRSRLFFMSALKIGASALKHKTIRLVLSILLASTAFTMFGLTDTMASFKQKRTAMTTMIEKDIQTSLIRKLDIQYFDDFNYEMPASMTTSDIDLLNDIDDGIKLFPIIDTIDVGIRNHIANTSAMYEHPYYEYDIEQGVTSVSTTDLAEAGLSILGGRLPIYSNEIAIPEYFFNAYKEFEFAALNSATAEKIENYNDIIGKKIDNLPDSYTIVGVIDTNLDLKPYESLLQNTSGINNQSPLRTQLRKYLATGFHRTTFISADNFDYYTNENNTFYDKYYSLDLKFYFDNPNEQIYDKLVKPLSNIENTNTTIFIDENDNFSNIGEDDVIINMAYLRQNNSALDSEILSQITSIKNTVSNATDNDDVIETFLKDNYAYFAFTSADDVPAASSWTTPQKETYRGHYANAIMDTNFLYERNPYQANNTGKTLFVNALTPYIRTNLANLKLTATTAGLNETVNTFDHPIVGVDVDYRYYLTSLTDTSSTLVINMDETTAEGYELSLKGPYNSAIVNHGTNRQIINKLLDLDYLDSTPTASHYYRLDNAVMDTVTSIGFLFESFTQIFTIIGIIFAVFAALLLVNFITLSVTFKHKEIGILRAIGARGVDVSSIFMNEAGIIAAINSVISIVATFIFAAILNNYFKTEIGIDMVVLVVGIRQIGLLIIIAFGIAALSSFLPVFRLSRKKPIDAIKNR